MMIQDRDMKQLKHLMRETYANRRQMINSSKSITQVIDEFPALGLPECIVQEFEMLTQTKNMECTVKSNIENKVMKLVELAGKSKGRKDAKIQVILKKLQLLQDSISNFYLEHDLILKTTAGILLLPLMLGDEEDVIFKECTVGF